MWQAILVGAGTMLALYGIFLGWLVLAGRRDEARAAAGFVPDFVVLFRRLLSDPRIPPRRKVVLAAVVAYLLFPIDLVPDFVPVAGYLDDAVVVAFALRWVLRGGGPGLIEEHWPGPPASLSPVLRLAGCERAEFAAASRLRGKRARAGG